MNAVEREIDRQQDDRMRVAADRHDAFEDNRIDNAPRGAQVVQINHVSTPVLVAMILVAALSAAALGLAINARDSAQLAEREARLAQRTAADNTSTLEALKIVASRDNSRIVYEEKP